MAQRLDNSTDRPRGGRHRGGAMMRSTTPRTSTRSSPVAVPPVTGWSNKAIDWAERNNLCEVGRGLAGGSWPRDRILTDRLKTYRTTAGTRSGSGPIRTTNFPICRTPKCPTTPPTARRGSATHSMTTSIDRQVENLSYDDSADSTTRFRDSLNDHVHSPTG